MGKGTIVSGGTDGLYQVKLHRHRDRINARLASLNTLIAAETSALAAFNTALTTATTARDASLAALDADIAAYNAGTKTEADVKKATEAAIAARLAYDKALGNRDASQLKITALEKEKDHLTNNTPDDPTVAAWCADFTENLSGEVGTIEAPGDKATPAIIQPGYAGTAGYTAARDGCMQPAIASTPAGSFANWARQPAHLNHKPRYRTGTITSIGATTCSVNLDAASVSHQGLDVNQSATLDNVPFDYMNCTIDMLTVGDHVVLEFSGGDWASAAVVGFVSNPRQCDQTVIKVAFVSFPSATGVPAPDTNICSPQWSFAAGALALHDSVEAALVLVRDPGSLSTKYARYYPLTFDYSASYPLYAPLYASKIYGTGVPVAAYPSHVIWSVDHEDGARNGTAPVETVTDAALTGRIDAHVVQALCDDKYISKYYDEFGVLQQQQVTIAGNITINASDIEFDYPDIYDEDGVLLTNPQHSGKRFQAYKMQRNQIYWWPMNPDVPEDSFIDLYVREI